jgi:hypothetical protein
MIVCSLSSPSEKHPDGVCVLKCHRMQSYVLGGVSTPTGGWRRQNGRGKVPKRERTNGLTTDRQGESHNRTKEVIPTSEYVEPAACCLLLRISIQWGSRLWEITDGSGNGNASRDFLNYAKTCVTATQPTNFLIINAKHPLSAFGKRNIIFLNGRCFRRI